MTNLSTTKITKWPHIVVIRLVRSPKPITKSYNSPDQPGQRNGGGQRGDMGWFWGKIFEKKIAKMNIAEMSRKIFSIKNIWNNASFIKNNYPPEMVRLWTLFSNPKWFQLFVYFFSKKNFFLRKTTPTHFKFSWMCQGHFCHFWKFLLVNLKPVFLRCLGTHTHQRAKRINFLTQNGLYLWYEQDMLYYESFPLICDFCSKLFGQFLFFYFSEKQRPSQLQKKLLLRKSYN